MNDFTQTAGFNSKLSLFQQLGGIVIQQSTPSSAASAIAGLKAADAPPADPIGPPVAPAKSPVITYLVIAGIAYFIVRKVF